MGRLLDAEAEHLGDAPVQAFETEGLIGTGAAPAVLAYLFHRIEDRLDGRPTLIIIDEGWLALDDPVFAGQLREWLKTLRKKNAQRRLRHPDRSPTSTAAAIAPAIIESCPTRLFLPNERAIEPQIAAIYRRFGLNDRQIEILAPGHAQARLLLPVAPRQPPVRAGPRRGRARLHRRLLARPTRPRSTDCSPTHGRDGFAAAWLRHRGLDWAADLIPDLTPAHRRRARHDPSAASPARAVCARSPSRSHAPQRLRRAQMDRLRSRPTMRRTSCTAARTLQQINNQITCCRTRRRC